MSGHDVRPLDEDDLQQVWQIFCDGSVEIASQEPLLPFEPATADHSEFRGAIQAELQDDDHLHLVADHEQRCAGWGHAHVAYTPDQVRIGYVSAVYVAGWARGRGLGSGLLTALTTWLREQAVERIELVTPSRTRGRSLWLRRGFRPLMETLVLDGD